MSQVIVATCLTSWWPSEGRLRAFAGVEVVALACAPGSSPLSSKSSHQLKDLGLDVDRRHASKSWRSRKAPDLDVDGRHVPKCYCRKWLKHSSRITLSVPWRTGVWYNGGHGSVRDPGCARPSAGCCRRTRRRVHRRCLAARPGSEIGAR